MTTELVVHDDGLAPEVVGSAYDLAERISKTEFVPGSLRGKPEAVMACILTGREVGIGPMQALSKIHVVDGRPAMAAELMRALVLAAGHDVWFEEKSSTRVTVAGRRGNSDKTSKVTWTMDDAKRAGLASKNNWRRYPRAMLTARATAELCRDIFADCLGGVSYSLEELEDGTFEDTVSADGEPLDDEPKAERKTVRRKSPSRQKVKRPPLPHERAAADGAGEDDVVDAEVVDETSKGSGGAAGEHPQDGGSAAGDSGGDGSDQGHGEVPESGPSLTVAQRLAMKADDEGIDEETRHVLVSMLTNGRTESGKDVTDEEASALFELYHVFGQGGLELRLHAERSEWFLDDGKGKALVPAVEDGRLALKVPPRLQEGASGGGSGTVDPGGAVPDPAGLRERAKSLGVNGNRVLGTANRLARERGEGPVQTLDDLDAASAGLLAALSAWVEGEGS